MGGGVGPTAWAQRTKSRGPKGLQLEVGAGRKICIFYTFHMETL